MNQNDPFKDLVERYRDVEAPANFRVGVPESVQGSRWVLPWRQISAGVFGSLLLGSIVVLLAQQTQEPENRSTFNTSLGMPNLGTVKLRMIRQSVSGSSIISTSKLPSLSLPSIPARAPAADDASHLIRDEQSNLTMEKYHDHI